MSEGDAERLRYRAEYCDLLEREVGELRTQVGFLRDVADGRRQPGTDPPNISSPPIRPHSAKEPKATPPRGQDSPLQIHGGQQPQRRRPSPATASRQPSTPSLCEDEEVDDMEWLQPTRSAGQPQDELEDDDPEELMCSATRSSMVLNELTGKMELRMVDGSAVVPSDKVTNREKFEILQERVVIMFEDRRLRKILTEWGNLIVERESKQNMGLLVVRRFQNKLKKKVIWRWYLDQQEEARMRAKMVHVKRKLGRMKLLRALARWKLFNENIRKSRMVVQHMLRRLSYYSLRGTFHVWWGKCRKKQRYLYLVEKFMARWRGNTLSNFLTLWYRLVKQYACYRVTVQRFSHRRVSGLYKEGYRHWRRLAQQSICGRSQSSALQALRACSVDSFFRGWDSTITGATGYQAFCGVEVDPETRAVVQLVLPARLLKRLPPEICHLSKLTSLFLEGNYLKALPSEIGELSALTSMRLNNNQLTMLPSEIGRLSALHTLAAAGNMIEALPSTISSLSNLNVLNLQNNRLHVLPPAIGHLSGLHILALNGNQLQNIPPHISLLTNLKTLTLSSNQLTFVPPALWKLPSLGSLNLAGNKLRAIGDDIAMQNLSDLNLEDNLLQELPPAVGNLTHLKELNLTINKLTELPQEVTALTALEVLNIASNRLTALPPGMAALTSLTALYAYNNAITTVPPDVFNLTRLEKLSLSTNDITGLPAEQLGKLGLLRVLSLNENKIERLAGDFFVDMTNLEVLKLSDNRLSEVPRELGTLSNLQELSLDGNAIKALPEEVSALAAVCEISVEENPISGVMAAALTAPHADKEPLPRRTRRKVKERARARPLDGLQTWAPSAPLRRIATRRQSDTDLGYLMDESRHEGMSQQTLPWDSSPASTVGYNSTLNSPGNNDSLFRSPSVVVKGYNEPHAVDRDTTTGRPLEHNQYQGERGDAAFPQRVPSVSRCMSSRVHDRSSSRRFVRSDALGSFKRSEGSHLRHSDSAIAPQAGLPTNAADELAVADTVFEEASDEGEEPSFESSQGQPPRFHFPPPSPRPSDDGVSAVKEETDIEASNSTGSAINFFGVERPFIVPTAPAATTAPAIDFFGGHNAPTSIANSSASSTPQHQSSMSGVGFFGVSEPFIMPPPPSSAIAATSSVMSAPAGAYFNTPANDRSSRQVALCNTDDIRGRFQFGVSTSPEGMQLGTTRTPHPPLTSTSNNGYDYFGAVGPAAAAPSNSFQQYFNKYPPTNPLFQA